MIANIIVVADGDRPEALSDMLPYCVDHDLTLGYRLDPVDMGKNEAVLSLLLREEKARYCVFLPLPAGITDARKKELMDVLYGFLLGLGYLKVNTRPVVGGMDDSWSLSGRLTGLGLHEPLAPEERVAAPDGYSSILGQPYAADQFVIIHGHEPAEIGGLVSVFESAEADLQQKDPALMVMQQEYKKLKNDLTIARNTITAVREDNLSHKKYLDFLRNSIYDTDGTPVNLNEIEKIKRFYYFEYEVLPLWFKRLGHVVKVIAGRRTLRSLFDDKVKKYKD